MNSNIGEIFLLSPTFTELSDKPACELYGCLERDVSKVCLAAVDNQNYLPLDILLIARRRSTGPLVLCGESEQGAFLGYSSIGS